MGNLIEYGQLTNPCVNLEKSLDAGRKMVEFFYNDRFECYSILEQYRD